MLTVDDSDNEHSDDDDHSEKDETVTQKIEFEDSSSDSGEDFEEISDIKLCWADM